MTDPAIPLAWDDEPDAINLGFDGFIALTSLVWGPCVITGWFLRLPWRLARAVRRWNR